MFSGQVLYYITKEYVKKETITTVDKVLELLRFYHSSPSGGHSGINNTQQKISSNYIWNGMVKDVKEYVSIK